MDLTKSISYFKSLIDENGIIQFTKGYEKDYSFGYAIEDQARALILAIFLKDEDLVNKFFKITTSSIARGQGVNMLWDVNRKFLGEVDNFGEASAEVLWAFAELKESEFGKNFNNLQQLTEDLKGGLFKTNYSRVMAYTVIGLAKTGDMSLTELADKLCDSYEKNKDKNWKWFEKEMTYGNVLLPWSLFLAYGLTKTDLYLKNAKESMEFLFDNLTRNGKPTAVGNEGWWQKGGSLPLYGQQPIDFSYMTLACLDAHRIIGEKQYLEKADFYYSWFTGNNLNDQNMRRDDGACYDGLYEKGVNPNAGAESNICFLLASFKMQEVGLL